jgi:hypothetical protein
VLRLSLPARLVPPLATIKLALGLIAFCATYESAAGRNPAFPHIYYLVFAAAFSATGALLLLGGRGDRRALALGGFFLSASTAWCNGPLLLFAASGAGRGLFALANALALDAFLPYFFWVFAREFPAPPPSPAGRRGFQVGVRLSAVAGLSLFGLNLLRFLLPSVPRLADLLDPFAAARATGIFYRVVISLTGAAFLVLPWKARQAQGSDQRRGRVFLQLLGCTFGPMLTFLSLYLFAPGVQPVLDSRPRLMLGIVSAVLAPGLALPVTVPYAVLVHRVLDVRLIARRALQYALARSLATGLVAVPLGALAVYFYVHSDWQITRFFSGPQVPFLLSAIGVGAAALRYRKPLLDAVDRRFFREQYDARQILTLLVERIRSIRDSASLADLVSRQIDLALHLERVSLMALDARSGLLIDPRDRTLRLDPSSPLVLAMSSAPLEVDLQNPHSPLRKLSGKERQCLEEHNFRLLVPILARDGALLGLIALGEKKSGLPFLKEDRQLLHATASNAAWVLELEQESATLTPRRPGRDWLEPDDPTPRELPAPPPAAEPAKECAKCGALHPSYTVFCSTCSRRLETSAIPYILPGRFRFERRIGAGGMGVVYAGADLALGRRVAIKTLRQVSTEDAMRLRREARTAAAVSHPHLAPIYGMETWQGMPLLVMELLEGGTLAQRVTREKLSPRETVELGCAMAGALAQLHAADILHRDIKPSNIGYTRDRVPKLMDFGIARVMFDLADEEAEEDGLERLEEDDDLDADDLAPSLLWAGAAANLARHRLAGTLSYLSPEALRGEPADITFDLWSLAIVLYECLLGRKVFVGTQQQVMERIRSAAVPHFSQIDPDHDATLGEFFRAALHRSPSRRPASAAEMKDRLEEIREGLGG